MFIYAIGNNESRRQKIGFTSNVEKRLKTLQTGNPDRLEIVYSFAVPADRVRKLERHLHKDIGYKRIQGEWFDMTAKEVTDYLKFAEIRWLDDILI